MKAPVGRRIIAYFVDILMAKLVFAVLFLVGVILHYKVKSVAGSLLGFVLILVAIILPTGYILLRDGLFNGASLGKRIVKIRVVKSDGSRSDFTSSALRNITFLVPLLNIIELALAVIDIEGRRIGDKIARTHVVE